MSTLSMDRSGSTRLGPMARIEARRLARHPAFLIGVVLAFGITALMVLLDDAPFVGDLLSMPVIVAFFIGLSSLVATARLTRSTEVTAEALGTAPGTESRRTAALVIACLVPFAAGLLYVGMLLGLAAARGVHPDEWWFGTMPDWKVWTILVALAPVACLGGALLGVLTGRWLRFPGAAAVVVVGLVVVDMVGQLPVTHEKTSELRLWVPWAMFHSGSETDGTAAILAGNPAAYLGYLLCLCAAAALMAVWHDRTARTGRLRAAIAGVTVLGLGFLALAMTTGAEDNVSSEPIPFQVGGDE
jgi:hypothetical protein